VSRTGWTTSTLAVVVVRAGRLPGGTDETVSEAGGHVLVVGSGAERAAASLADAATVRWCDTGEAFRPGELALALAPECASVPLVLLPASPDGRDLAPRLAAQCDRPLVARALSAACVADEGAVGAERADDGSGATRVQAVVARLDDRALVPVEVAGPAVVTLVGHSRAREPEPPGRTAATGGARDLRAVTLGTADRDRHTTERAAEPEFDALLEPDLRTMDLADATRVLGGGAGLVPGDDERRAEAVFDLLGAVAAALGGSAGATRVATDAGWTGYERQIGTTGVAIDPDLYVALGVSGAAQHVGGLGAPRHIVSVNTDASSPMTAMADLGLVTDAQALLVELARRFAVALPEALSSGTGGARG
jgi:electron transfer flavoprotein alpha subunit